MSDWKVYKKLKKKTVKSFQKSKREKLTEEKEKFSTSFRWYFELHTTNVSMIKGKFIKIVLLSRIFPSSIKCIHYC